MVLVVSAPGILFVLYATHKIYHATVKFPEEGEGDDKKADGPPSDADSHPISYIHPPSLNKRKRDNSDPPPIYVVERRASSLKREKARSDKSNNSGDNRRSKSRGDSYEIRKRRNNRYDEDRDITERRDFDESNPKRRWDNRLVQMIISSGALWISKNPILDIWFRKKSN